MTSLRLFLTFLERCDGGLATVLETDKTYPFRYICSVRRIDSVMVWSPDGWKNFVYNTDPFLQSELILDNGDLVHLYLFINHKYFYYNKNLEFYLIFLATGDGYPLFDMAYLQPL